MTPSLKPMGMEPQKIERRARAMWAEREKRFPRFVRLTWEQGTVFAREKALVDAAAALEHEAAVDGKDRDHIAAPQTPPTR